MKFRNFRWPYFFSCLDSLRSKLVRHGGDAKGECIRRRYKHWVGNKPVQCANDSTLNRWIIMISYARRIFRRIHNEWIVSENPITITITRNKLKWPERNGWKYAPNDVEQSWCACVCSANTTERAKNAIPLHEITFLSPSLWVCYLFWCVCCLTGSVSSAA